MSWQHPLVLLLVPAALLGSWLLFRRRDAGADDRLPHVARRWVDRLGLHARAPLLTRRAGGLTLGLAAALALAALARPQWGEIPEQRVTHAREVMIALDLSRSMLADDVSPTRLARAKLLVEALLDSLRGERVGLTVFAGTAFVQSPLSADYEVLRQFLAALDPSYLPQGGTDYGAMLRAATGAFGGGDGDRFLVVLSDGEAHDDAWQDAVPALRQRGIRVIGLGVGTPAGGLVPDADGGVLRDAGGAAVRSRLEPATLQALAAESGGTYRDAATWVDLAELVDATVAQGRAGAYVEEHRTRRADRFQWFLAPAVVLFLLSYWLELPLSPLARALSTRGRRPHRASAPVIAAALAGLAAWHPPRQAQAVATDTLSPPQSVATATHPLDLAATVAELSARPALDAADHARLATDTVSFAAQPSAPRGAARDGIIDDALAAVTRGEAQDARAADWPALRRQLEALRQPPEAPQPPNEQPNGQGGDADPQQAGGGEGSSPDAEQEQNAQAGGDGEPADAASAGGREAPQDAPASESPARAPTGDGGAEPGAAPRDDQAAAEDGTRRPDAPPARDSSGEATPDSAAAEQQAGASPQGGEVPREDAQPLDSAGLDDTGAAPAPAAAPPGTRLVGGRSAAAAPASDDPQVAEALARLQQVEEGDAPAVLFDRMNRAEGRPESDSNGKNW